MKSLGDIHDSQLYCRVSKHLQGNSSYQEGFTPGKDWLILYIHVVQSLWWLSEVCDMVQALSCRIVYPGRLHVQPTTHQYDGFRITRLRFQLKILTKKMSSKSLKKNGVDLFTVIWIKI